MKKRMTIAELAAKVAAGERHPYEAALRELLIKHGLVDRPIVVKAPVNKVIVLTIPPGPGYMMMVYDLLPVSGQRKGVEVEVPEPRRHPGHCYPPSRPSADEDEED